LSEHLYRFADTCSIYIIVDSDEALLIDAGSGAVAGALAETGAAGIEWVLHTHHHRDQCAGTPALAAAGARVAVPEHERHLFEEAELFWRTRRVYDNYDDRNTFFTAARDITVDAALEDYETFTWRGYRFEVVPAKGHTRGSSMLIATIDGQRVAFTGDLMSAGGRLYQLHAMEYAYGGMEGIAFTIESIDALARLGVQAAYPSHGDAITDVAGDIARLRRRLADCVALGNAVRVAGAKMDLPASHFLPDGRLQPLSRHLLWGGPWTCSNFYVVLSDSGKAMFVDYGHSLSTHMHTGPDHSGFESMRFVVHHLDELRADYGVTDFDLVVPTHIHDDHTCGIPYLQRHHGTRCWALHEVAQVLEDPAAWSSTPCTMPKPIRIDRRLQDGERFTWEEYSFDICHAPGQTEFHSVYAGLIDGRRVAFTGDNFFVADVLRAGATISKPYQTTVMRNSFQLGMHRRCAEVMRRVDPELICPGHRDVIDCSKQQLDEYADFIARKERAFRNLVAEPADHYVDLFWARLLPYLATVKPGQTVEYRLMLRNNLERDATYTAELDPPPGWSAGAAASVRLRAGERGEVTLEATAPAAGDGIRRLVTAQIAVDGQPQGAIAEALVTVSER
jgi:glyoxylase-like metal-dependent hydrolase (beta-lactamase superfamily II)